MSENKNNEFYKCPIAIFLQEELHRRKIKNKSYSLRAFARDLGINKTSLSACMLDMRQLSRGNFEKLLTTIAMNQETRAYLQSVFDDAHAGGTFVTLRPEDAGQMNGWIAFALLDSIPIEGSTDKASWFAARLNLDESAVQHYLDFLLREKYIEHDVISARFQRTVKNLSTPEVYPNDDKYYLESLEQVMDLINFSPATGHNFYSMTLAADSKSRDKIKELAIKFFHDIAALETTNPSSHVYKLNLQLIPCKNFRPLKSSPHDEIK